LLGLTPVGRNLAIISVKDAEAMEKLLWWSMCQVWKWKETRKFMGKVCSPCELYGM